MVYLATTDRAALTFHEKLSAVPKRAVTRAGTTPGATAIPSDKVLVLYSG